MTTDTIPGQSFDIVEHEVRSGGPNAAFDLLVRKFREERNYPLLFEARLMQKRHELGLPLIQTGHLSDLPEKQRAPYEASLIEAAREVGHLFLAEGDLPRAWSYFRAIGEPGPVAAAIDQIQPGDGIEPVIEIAFHERVNPRKGFELILASFGICRAITSFDQYPVPEGRDDCLRLLVRTLHNDLVENLKRTIAQNEEQAPETRNVPELIAGREWLFGEYSYYVDTSHLVSIIRLSPDLDDPKTLELALELTEYGKRLSPFFHYKGDPPFENIYEDYGAFLRALLGQDVDSTIEHFRRKIEADDPGGGAPQVLVGLLVRLDRYAEAIEVAQRYLEDLPPSQLACLSVPQLCQLSGNFARLQEIGREKNDLLSYAAGLIQAGSGT